MAWAAAGWGAHYVLIRNDGTAICRGSNNAHGERDVPELAQGVTYTQASVGKWHTVLLRSDGHAVAFGDNRWGQCDIPELTQGATYTQISAGGAHTVLLRNDGMAVACGDHSFGQCSFPPSNIYTQVSCGWLHTVLLHPDGTAIACGENSAGQCNIPVLPGPVLPIQPVESQMLKYTQISAGFEHTVLLRSDGTAMACGDNSYGQCMLDGSATYKQVSAGVKHTVLLCSNGRAVQFGRFRKMMAIPPLLWHLRYVRVDAGNDQIVLRRSDGATLFVGYYRGVTRPFFIV